MEMEDENEARAEGPGTGLAFVAFSGITAAVLLFVVLMLTLAAFGREGEDPRAARNAPSTAPGAPAGSFHGQRTVVYLVSSQAQAAELGSALTEWRLELEALGTAAQEPRRVVVVQTPEEVVLQRVIEFSILATQAPGLDLQVIDLR